MVSTYHNLKAITQCCNKRIIKTCQLFNHLRGWEEKVAAQNTIAANMTLIKNIKLGCILTKNYAARYVPMRIELKSTFFCFQTFVETDFHIICYFLRQNLYQAEGDNVLNCNTGTQHINYNNYIINTFWPRNLISLLKT